MKFTVNDLRKLRRCVNLWEYNHHFLDSAAGKGIILMFLHKHHWSTIESIPVIDHLLSEMESRFSAHHKTALLGLHLIPSILVTKAFNELEDVLKPLEALYASDLRDGSFSTELHQWFLKWKKEEDTHGTQALSKSLAYTLPQCSSYYSYQHSHPVTHSLHSSSHLMLFREIFQCSQAG